MRFRHIIIGMTTFSLGLVLALQHRAVVAELLRGALPLAALLAGLLALAAAVNGRTYRRINGLVAAHLLALGGFMIYREPSLVVDGLRGSYPLALLMGGMITTYAGGSKLFLPQPADAAPGSGLIAHFVAIQAELFGDRTTTDPYLRQGIIGGVVGNVLEWYDFAVFGYFAPVIASQFFPNQDHLVSILCTYGVFAGSYFIRPVGGILFGHIGDRHGRKQALMLSVLMMAIPTGLIGLLPTYAQVGALAPVLLVILRLAQGLSVGGELIGSIAFITEIAPAKHRGFFGSWTFCGLTGGIMLGSLAATLAHYFINPVDLAVWGWRIPFILGVVIGALGLWMRSSLHETPEFELLKRSGQIRANPFAEVVYTMPWRLVQLAALVVLSGGGFYLLFVWWPTFLSDFLVPPIPNALFLNTISMVLLMVLIPVTGAISDQVGRRPMHILGAAGVVILAWPLFLLVSHATVAAAVIAQLIFTVLISIFMGPVPATMVELFPPGLRYMGTALGYNISLCIFGGTAPLVATWLLVRTGSINAPAWYLTAMALVSLAAAISLNGWGAGTDGDDDFDDMDD